MRFIIILAATVSVGKAAWWKVGPDHRPPTNSVPLEYKAGLTNLGTWKIAEPGQLDSGVWWQIFDDLELNQLQARASQNNNLQAAFARVNQARATARITRAQFLPFLSAGPSALRQRTSANAGMPFPANGIAFQGNNFSVPLDLSYELDIWGRVRRSFEAARADAEAEAANFQTILLTLRADLAVDYFALRALDAERAVTRGTIALRRENLDLMQKRLDAGASSELDVARAQTELATAESELAALNQQRVELENAIAILVGENPSEFRIAEVDNPLMAQGTVPVIPPGLPSSLLERRPDIAAAERQIASANARIGAVKGAAFPSVRLTGSAGYVSGDIETLFNWESRAWSIGPSISIPLFAGGRLRAANARARAAHEEALSNYRQRVLQAFAEVENSLSAIQNLAERAAAQQRAVTSAQRAAELARTRFEGGLVSYFEVMDAERTALQVQRGAAQLMGQQKAAVVQLIKALGGGFTPEAISMSARKI